MRVLHRRTILVAGIFGTAALAVLLFFAFQKPLVKSSPVASVSPLPDVIFKQIDGQEVSLASLRGRALVLDVWASWCSPCEAQIFLLAGLQKQFGDAVTIAEVNRGDSVEAVKQYADRLDADHALVFVMDAGDELYQKTGGFLMPETFFIDKEGMVRDHIRGSINAVEMERRIEDLINL